jgi:hypothetical protein
LSVFALFSNDFTSKCPEKKGDFFAFNLPQFILSAVGAQGLTMSGFDENGIILRTSWEGDLLQIGQSLQDELGVRPEGVQSP